MTSQSHMLPAYARVDLAFERGEGVWLIATNGDRYLDFASGVAVNALGHCASARGRGDHRAGQEGHPRLQPLPHPRGRAAGRAALRDDLRRQGVFRQFRRRGDGRRHQDGAQVPVRQRPSGALPHHHLRGLVPRPDAGDAWRRPRTRSISTASARPMDGFDQVPLGDLEGAQGGDHARDRRHHHRAGAGRGRRALGAAAVLPGAAQALRRERPAARVRRGADRHRPARRDVRLPEDRRDARRHGAGQGARRAAFRSARCWRPRRPPRA